MGIEQPEWPGAAPRWHIQGHQRDELLGGPGPQGPAHWPRRPHDVGGFCASVDDSVTQGRRHAYDPPSHYVPAGDRSRSWNFCRRPLKAYGGIEPRPTGTRQLHPNIVENDNLGWTGKYNNFTGPRHFPAKTTVIEPSEKQSTRSYYLEKVIGTKKAVPSSTMGLQGIYDDSERRMLRPAVEWSLDGKLQRKIRIPDLEDKRNGIGVANPGDKGYGTSEHAPEYFEKMKMENRGRGNMVRRVMSKIDKTWSMSGADPLVDKKGRRMSDYIQLYCKTPYRKNSMYVHRDCEIKEIADMAGEGGSKKQHVYFKGQYVAPQCRLLELGIIAKDTVELVVEEEPIVHKPDFNEKEAKRLVQSEVGEVGTLGNDKAKKPAEGENDELEYKGEEAYLQ